MAFWWLVVWVAVAVISALLPKQKTKTNAPTPADISAFDMTTADESKRVPVLFGTRLIGVNVIWYGDLRSEAIVSKSGGKK